MEKRRILLILHILILGTVASVQASSGKYGPIKTVRGSQLP